MNRFFIHAYHNNMNSIEFVFCNKIFVLEYYNNRMKIIEQKTGKVIMLTEEHQNIDDPLFNLATLVSKLIG